MSKSAVAMWSKIALNYRSSITDSKSTRSFIKNSPVFCFVLFKKCFPISTQSVCRKEGLNAQCRWSPWQVEFHLVLLSSVAKRAMSWHSNTSDIENKRFVNKFWSVKWLQSVLHACILQLKAVAVAARKSNPTVFEFMWLLEVLSQANATTLLTW